MTCDSARNRRRHSDDTWLGHAPALPDDCRVRRRGESLSDGRNMPLVQRIIPNTYGQAPAQRWSWRRSIRLRAATTWSATWSCRADGKTLNSTQRLCGKADLSPESGGILVPREQAPTFGHGINLSVRPPQRPAAPGVEAGGRRGNRRCPAISGLTPRAIRSRLFETFGTASHSQQHATFSGTSVASPSHTPGLKRITR